MNPVQFAEHRNTTERTVRRWLKDGWLPGATQYPDGRWDIPRDAIEQKPLIPPMPAAPANGHDVSGVMSVARQGDTAQGPSLAQALDQHPAMLSLEQASRLLGVEVAAIIRNRERFAVEELGRAASTWRVPGRIVREIAGL
jgi:hypothetical protein